MQIRKSAEDYLEAILVLSKQGDGVRSIDIATMLGVSKPSVSHAMKLSICCCLSSTRCLSFSPIAPRSARVINAPTDGGQCGLY